MKKTNLEKRIKELELELSILKSSVVETKQAAKSTFEDSGSKFLTLANYIPAYIAYVNADTLQYEFVNDLYEKSFGIPHENIIGSHIKNILGEANYQFALRYIEKVRSGKSCSYENTFNIATGKRWLQVNYSPVFDAQSKVIGIALVSYDITEHKLVEQELINAKEKAEESDHLKSAFLANMSHEIRTPMNGILGFTGLLKEPALSSDEQLDFIQTIQISGNRMLSTINNIVDMSKIESGLIQVDLKETNINEKMEFAYKFFKPEVESKGLQFFFKNSLPAKEAIIESDNEKIYAILTNLVKNAIKFTYEGSIEFGYILKSDREPAELEFYVQDTGIGIPEKYKEIIFERFRQGNEENDRSYEGSGLGLSISKSYVKMLGGKIWVISEEGKGSTFYFTVPYKPVTEEKTEIKYDSPLENEEGKEGKLKILIVEDDEISYSLLTRMLRKISSEILHSITGTEAVGACRNNPDLDLVLMDIRMPGMDGYEATRQIRQFNKDVIIIAETAYGFSSDREKAIDAGCNDYIAKPINRVILYELIYKHCNK